MDIRQHHTVVAGVAKGEDDACLRVGVGGGEEEVIGGVAFVDCDRLNAVTCPGICVTGNGNVQAPVVAVGRGGVEGDPVGFSLFNRHATPDELDVPSLSTRPGDGDGHPAVRHSHGRLGRGIVVGEEPAIALPAGKVAAVEGHIIGFIGFGHRIAGERVDKPLQILTGLRVVDAETGVPLPVGPAKALLFKPTGKEACPPHP